VSLASSSSLAPSSALPRVAVIGLGAMGLPIATRLAEKFSVTAFDPAAERLAAAVALGMTAAVTPAEASADADLVLLAVRDQAQLEAALFGEGGIEDALGAGSAIIITSTIGPDAVRAVAQRLAEKSIAVVDAPMSGGPVRAGLGDLLMVVGADEKSLALARPVLEHLASTLTIVGPRAGDGQVLKTINQLLAGVHIAAAAEAIALARGLGVDPDVVISALSEGAASSFMFSDRGPRMVEAYSGGAEVKSRLDIFVKDMGIVTAVSKEAHVPTPLAAAAQQLYLIAEQAGLGAHDDSTVVTVLSPLTAEERTPEEKA
jgi:3-hydroxyisobutyrate dehydrogenase